MGLPNLLVRGSVETSLRNPIFCLPVVCLIFIMLFHPPLIPFSSSLYSTLTTHHIPCQAWRILKGNITKDVTSPPRSIPHGAYRNEGWGPSSCVLHRVDIGTQCLSFPNHHALDVSSLLEPSFSHCHHFNRIPSNGFFHFSVTFQEKQNSEVWKA